jgi:hypothetical protein
MELVQCNTMMLVLTAALQNRARIPASIAAKSKEELQGYVLDLLKKLKLRDRKLEGRTGVQQPCSIEPIKEVYQGPGKHNSCHMSYNNPNSGNTAGQQTAMYKCS